MSTLTKEERTALARECYLNPPKFLQTFLPNLFPGPIPWVHRGLISVITGRTSFLDNDPQRQKIIDNFVYTDTEGRERPLFTIVDDKVHLLRRQYIEVMLPRGFSKTTLAGVGLNVYETVYGTVDFGCYISEAGAHAMMQLDNVKRELADNARIHEVFGDLRPRAGADEHWSADLFETRGEPGRPGAAWVARGRGSQVRGLNHRGRRPSKIILDDVEDKESVSTELQREKTRTWFYSDVVPALPLVGRRGQIIVLGTLLHPEALMEIVARDPQWSVVRFGPYDKDGELLWPEAIDAQKLEAKKQSAILMGQLPSFYLEWYNRAHDEESARFKKSWFVYGAPPKAEEIAAVSTYMDPAISKNASADETVILSVAQDKKGRLYLLDGWGKRGAEQSEVMDEYFRQKVAYSSRFCGIEANGFQAALATEMRRQMFTRGVYFEVEEVKNTNKKSDRILGILQPRFGAGYITLCRRFTRLESQLLDFNPDRDLHDDWPDALAGAIKLLDPVAGYSSPKASDNEDDIPSVEEVIRAEQRAGRRRPRYRGAQ